MIFPTKTIERNLFRDGYQSVIGVDEVGMGCLAGPVVVCAVSLTKAFYQRNNVKLLGIRDSKLLTPRQREAYATELFQSKWLKYQISYCYPQTIDKLNIYQAARKAMRRAISKLTSRESMVLVDGPHLIAGLDLPQRAIIKGDRTVFAIACASVIAKVHRDRMMARYAKRFPQYGFECHKGYGTKLHVAMLAQYGPSAIHRHSFAPVEKLV